MGKFIVGAHSDRIFQALHDSGVITDDPASIRRVVIDLNAGAPARFYVEGYVDHESLTEALLHAELITPGEGGNT